MDTNLTRIVKPASLLICPGYYTLVTGVGKQMLIWQKKAPMLELPLRRGMFYSRRLPRWRPRLSGRRFLCIGKETIIEEITEWLNRAKNAHWRLLYFGG